MPRTHSHDPSIFLVAAVSVGLLCVVLCDTGSGQAETINLQPRFETGRAARYSLWSQRDSRMDVNFAGRQQTFERSTVVEGEATWTVERVHTDGSARCKLVLDWLAVTMTTPDGERIAADSRRGDGDVPGLDEAVTALTQTPLSYEVGPDAVIRRVDGLRDVQRKLKDLPPDAFTEADLMEIAYDLAIVGNAPSDARPGTRWRHELERSHELGVFDVRMDYELAGTEWIAGQELAHLQGRGQLRFEAKNDDGNTQVDVVLRDPTCEEQVMWDPHRGEVVGRNESRAYTLAMTIQVGDQQTVRQTLTETVQGQALRIAEE